MIHFLDTSALVKRYVREPGSEAVATAIRKGTVVLARITYAEILAALARATREKLLTESRRDRIFREIGLDFRTWTIIEIRQPVLDRIPGLVLRHPLRGYDAVQLAAALTVQDRGGTVQFWSADERLVAAAASEGLRTANPR